MIDLPEDYRTAPSSWKPESFNAEISELATAIELTAQRDVPNVYAAQALLATVEAQARQIQKILAGMRGQWIACSSSSHNIPPS